MRLFRRLLFRFYDSLHREVFDASEAGVLSGDFIVRVRQLPAVSAETELPPLYENSPYLRCDGCGVLKRGRHTCAPRIESKVLPMASRRRSG